MLSLFRFSDEDNIPTPKKKLNFDLELYSDKKMARKRKFNKLKNI